MVRRTKSLRRNELCGPHTLRWADRKSPPNMLTRVELCEIQAKKINKARKDIDRLECEIHEEEQWRGGHEEGAEDDAHIDVYDPMEY